MPATKPSQSTWMRKSGCAAICTKGSTRTWWSTSMAVSARHAEVGVDHILVALDLLRQPVGDADPVVEHHDAVAQIHHYAHVVLDERDRGAEMLAHVEHEAAHILLLLHIHAGHRLVEQEEVGLH